MDALDVYTKINIKDYLAHLEESKDKNYSKERKKLEKNIFEKMILKQKLKEELLIGNICCKPPIVFN